jgi:hypothetical protein
MSARSIPSVARPRNSRLPPNRMAAGEIVTAISFLGDQSEAAAPFTQ